MDRINRMLQAAQGIGMGGGAPGGVSQYGGGLGVAMCLSSFELLRFAFISYPPEMASAIISISNNILIQDTPNLIDNSETVHISSLALLKMLRHGRAGVPMEVMGLMLGEFVDEYTVRVVDVFAMPQSGTGVSVEAVDPVFQTKMMEMLRQTGR
jgi:26S proteasome regulatory subunit N11